MKNVLGIICGVLTVAAFILTFQIFNAWWLAVLILIIGVPVALIHEKIEKYQKTCSKCKTPMILIPILSIIPLAVSIPVIRTVARTKKE